MSIKGASLGLRVKYFLGKQLPTWVAGENYPNPCWAICDLRSDGRHCFALHAETGRGRFNTKQEAERGLQALQEAGITSGEDVKRIGADAYYRLVYRDLMW